ncbi:MAG TPA: ligase-associated DNA damage response endonuclease PdeM [Rhizomicrobium sp.]
MRIIVNKETLLLDALGAAFWPAESTLIVSDLHFEKGSSFARKGQMLPPYDTLTTLARIADLFARHKPARVIALGDSFHDIDGPSRLPDAAREMLANFISRSEWIWIEGNHDPDVPSWLGGKTTSEIAMGGLVFRHEPLTSGARGEIAGHLHPCTTVTRRGHSLRRRCFVSDGARLVMPAFGAYTGGLSVRDAAFAPLFGTAYLAYALGGRRVYAVAGDPQAVRRKISEENQPSSEAMSTVENP